MAATSSEPLGRFDPVSDFVGELTHLTTAKLPRGGGSSRDVQDDAGRQHRVGLATAAVARDLKRSHRHRTATLAYHRASEAVLAAPGADDLSHDEVVHTARAAGDVARARGRTAVDAVAVLTRGWEEFLAIG